MTTVKNKTGRKRGRPKKSVPAVKQELVLETKLDTASSKALNQVWGAVIYFNTGHYIIEAGRITFHTPSKDMSVDPMFEERKTAGWNNLVLALRGGAYKSRDSVTGTVTHQSLSSQDPTAWIENIETAEFNFGGGTYSVKELSKRYED